MKTKSTVSAVVKERQFEREGYNIHYYRSGTGNDSCIVMLHPAFGDHRCFDQQIDYFSKDYTVITLDLLGHGKSQPKKAKDKIDVSADHIKGILSNEGINSCHILGVSMGSLIAQDVAARYPELVKSLAVVGGYSIHLKNKTIEKAQRKEGIKWIFKILFSMESFRKYVADYSVHDPEQKARFYQGAQHFTRKSFRVMSGLGNIMNKQSHEKSIPLLILAGEHDLELTINAARDWHSKTTGSKFITIDHAGHCANMDNPVSFNAIYHDFILSVEQGK